ncbi:hypothetical protein ACIBI3_30950 [Actinomadura luteofluorescens]|uniref:hypothetical protein n=1 Tax=Actinomadura luteofluorescens TaxID=46163 RepID=UPI00347D0B0A
MKSFSYTELDKLAGEVLPERAVLSTLLVGGGENENANLNLNHGGGGDGTTAVVNACQSQQTRPDSGLLQLVGLHAQTDASSQSCIPGAVVSGH